MSKPVILCADSTCDLSEELVEKYKVHIMPLHITLDGQSYNDGVDIHPDDIYAVYAQKKVLPSTSATNMTEYEDFVRPFIEAGNEVVYVTLGSGLSTTHNNCRLAAEEMPGLYVVDSGNLSTGMGHVVIAAAEAIAAGASAAEAAEHARQVAGKVEASFVLDTLEFLYKGGRCSALAMMGANMLKLKPCIEVNNADGTMSVGKKYRGSLLKCQLAYVRDRLAEQDKLDHRRIFFTHSGLDEESRSAILSAIAETGPWEEILVTQAGGTIAGHCGPQCMGVLFFRK